MSIASHSKAATLGFFALVFAMIASLSGVALEGNIAGNMLDIGIEHQAPLDLTFRMGFEGTQGVAEFEASSEETIFISVPDSWKRKEVKHTSLDRVVKEDVSLGFARWSLPANAGVLFAIQEKPDGIVIHNPSRVQMKLDYAIVDLETEEVHADTILIQDDTTALWP